MFGGIEEEILPLTGEATSERGWAALSAGGRVVVGRKGAAGAVASDGGDPVASSGFEVQAVDTVGAGDAFNAGFIASRLAGSGGST